MWIKERGQVNDDDADGIPDHADGYWMNGADNNRAEDDFVPLELRVWAGDGAFFLEGAQYRLSCTSSDGGPSASDPAGATRSAEPPYTYVPAPGHIRIWKTDGMWSRDSRPANAQRQEDRGDYVCPGLYTYDQLGLKEFFDSGVFQANFYVEGIAPSTSMADQQIQMEIDPDGEGGTSTFVVSDAVRLTVTSLEFVDTIEKPEDVLPIFNPNPIVTLDQIAQPGNNEQEHINISGKVKDYVAPVEKVRVNGLEVAVTQTSSGTNGVGPFEGTFKTELDLTGNTTLIEALAINSLRNLGKDSSLIAVTRDANFSITGRTVTALDSVPAEPPNEAQYLGKYGFYIELTEPRIQGDQVEVELNSGTEAKTVKLARVGAGVRFRSENALFLCPSNLDLGTGASEVISATRIKSDPGKKATVRYSSGGITYQDIGIVTGLLIYKNDASTIADFLESCIYSDVTSGTASRSYLVKLGFPGGAGKTIKLSLQGLDANWADLAQPKPKEAFAALAPKVTLKRSSNDITSADYNLYTINGTNPIMAVRSRLPLDAAGHFTDNQNREEVYVVYDGALKAGYSASGLDVETKKPIVGMEIVAENSLAPNTYKAAEVLPKGNPPGPIISVADGAPRPRVEIRRCTYFPGAGGTATPRRIRVEGRVRDYIADLLPGNTLNEVGVRIEVNGTPLAMAAAGPHVPGDGVRIDRSANNPLRPFEATFDAFVDLTMIPDNTDRDAYSVNLNRGTRGNAVVVCQEAVIVRATNLVGNFSYDSAFVRIVDPNAATPAPPAPAPPPADFGLNPPYSVAAADGGGIIDDDTNLPTYAEYKPQHFFVAYNNPFAAEPNIANQTIRSKLPDDTDLRSMQITLSRNLSGNTYRYGPFITAAVHRSVTNPTIIPAAAPVLPTIRFARNAAGDIVSRDIVSRLETSGPQTSQIDISECMVLDLKLDSTLPGEDNRDSYLPGRTGINPVEGTDARPEQVTLLADVTPTHLISDLRIRPRLMNTTHFPGHCNNAPRPGTPGLNNDDFSFDRAGNSTQTSWLDVDANTGRATTPLFCKDFGGRTVVRARFNLPGNPDIFMEVPLDSDGDFLPDVWEQRFRSCPGIDPNRLIRDGLVDDEDRDLTGANVAHNEAGDGFTALQEYRGFQITTAPPAGPAATRVYRMDEIPFAYGQVPHANGDGTIVAGPCVKDVFIFHQSTVSDIRPAGAAANLAMDTTNAALFNVAWHRILEADFLAAQPAGTFQGHNHQINLHGTNDGFGTIQNAIHLRDFAGLPAGTLANAGSFYLDDVDIRVNPAAAGGGHGFADGLINGNTIFHEIGHKMSLRHNVGTTSQGAAVFAAAVHASDGTDLTGDGVPDGVFTVSITTYLPRGNAAADLRKRGELIRQGAGGAWGLSEGAQVTVGGTDRTNDLVSVTVTGTDDVGGAINMRLVINGHPVGGNAINVRGLVLHPDLMDWVDFWIAAAAGAADGPTQQQSLAGPQFVLPGQVHNRELRTRTRP